MSHRASLFKWSSFMRIFFRESLIENGIFTYNDKLMYHFTLEICIYEKIKIF